MNDLFICTLKLFLAKSRFTPWKYNLIEVNLETNPTFEALTCVGDILHREFPHQALENLSL
jgi:hypothetical protein